MEVVESNSRSIWEDSQISPEISVQVAENVEGFQKCVKEIVKLIEQEGSFSEMTAEVYDDKNSKLTTRVAELSRMHTALADQHVHLIGEVSKNCPSLIKKSHLDSSDSSSPKVTQMFTPDQMSNTHKFRTPIGFDVFSSGGGGSYASRKEAEASESSFSLSSDSESESFMSIGKLLVSPLNDDALKARETKVHGDLHQKISNLEEEVVTLNNKLQSLIDENTNLQHQIQENESDKCIRYADLETEKAKVIELQKQVVDLKVVISDSNLKVKTMGQELEASSEKLSIAEDEISKLKDELSNKKFEQTQWLQELGVLQKLLDSEKDKYLGLQEEVSLCIADISVRDDQITELNLRLNQSISEISLLKSTYQAKEDTWKADLQMVKMEVREKCQSVENLNKYLDALKLQKDGVTAQLDTLRAEMRSQDISVQELETRLNSLQVEHARVLSSFDNAQKSTNELNLKVAELEREVDRQKEVMSDRAEEKREAIRQLSFSLDHYMAGYKELRQAFVCNKRRAVLTS